LKKVNLSNEEKIEAATFRKLRTHLLKRTDIQNIDIMNTADFCRNCLSRWYMESALELNVKITKEEAREIFYDMPYEEWKKKYQK
tara:strand:- start:169 stop:423 length:255 start_codon:yes stop_codon:yes gene_type:complete